MSNQSEQQSNMLGNASLALGIASAALVFGIGFCSVIETFLHQKLPKFYSCRPARCAPGCIMPTGSCTTF